MKKGSAMRASTVRWLVSAVLLAVLPWFAVASCYSSKHKPSVPSSAGASTPSSSSNSGAAPANPNASKPGATVLAKPVLPGAAPEAPAPSASTDAASGDAARASSGNSSGAPARSSTDAARAKPLTESARFVREQYEKREVSIPMRDGVKLFTSIYEPRERAKLYPILLCRTPYSVGPYGEGEFKDLVGPSEAAMRDFFIIVYQDVRGCHMSDGTFVDVRPHIASKMGKQIDESTDAYDTIEWLLANVPDNNGKVGMWGISYPGFYAAASMIDHHPALVAVSPQAPIADWFFDDFHHHGTLFLPHAFNFLSSFGQPRTELTTKSPERFKHDTPDGYDFFLRLGPLLNVDERYFHGKIQFWEDLVAHPNYDEFWEARNLQPNLKNVAPAVLTVGGWFDAEDLYGALHVYSAIEKQNPGIYNAIVMGPWQHGGWARTDGDRLGNVRFGAKTSIYYREKIELAFFDHFLKGTNDPLPTEATMFETGANQWRRFTSWPPEGLRDTSLYVTQHGLLVHDTPPTGDAADTFESDPARPVPYTEAISDGMTKEYMTDDQRFAGRRPDVLVYRTDPLPEPVTIAGPIQADLWVSTTGTDADWMVKLVDVFPDDTPAPEGADPTERPMGGYQMMVRSEAFRGRFRESYAQPKPFVPDEPTLVTVPLQDVLHTFAKGHRIMVQIESTWFPLVDRNPQTFVDNIFKARAEDFRKATHKVYRSAEHPTRIRFGMLVP
jgi:putative CocE/NonD family hydrolase